MAGSTRSVTIHCYHKVMALGERALFTDKPEPRPGRYQCPRCRRTNDYRIRWVRRSKKERLPPGANEDDRAKFAKLRDYLLRLDDEVTCKTYGTKFEIQSQHSLLFLDHSDGWCSIANVLSKATEITSASMTAIDRYGFVMSANTRSDVDSPPRIRQAGQHTGGNAPL